MEVILSLTLSLTILILVILSFKLVSKNSKLRHELEKSFKSNSDLKSHIRELEKSIFNLKKENVISILPGQKAIMPNYSLCTTGTGNKISFEVTYEVDIVDVSDNKVKVRSTNYVSNHNYANDVNNRNKILLFMVDKWVSKKEIELVISDSDRRNAKLENLLGDK